MSPLDIFLFCENLSTPKGFLVLCTIAPQAIRKYPQMKRLTGGRIVGELLSFATACHSVSFLYFEQVVRIVLSHQKNKQGFVFASPCFEGMGTIRAPSFVDAVCFSPQDGNYLDRFCLQSCMHIVAFFHPLLSQQQRI